MNIAVIFAGGIGKRMGKTDKPKQFMEISEKPIIIHTLEVFENNKNIDKIIISCLNEWITYLESLIEKYKIKKVDKIVPGGATGQMSIFNGLHVANQLYPEDSIVLIHDGVRPFIDDELINSNIESVEKKGSAISSVMSTETFVLVDENKMIMDIPERCNSLVAKAPQSFYLKDIYEIHKKAQHDNIYDSIDSCTLMHYYNKKMSVVLTDYDNIKITTPKDIALAESIYNRRLKQKENS
jgi:2-C-methyl-D-erythritol 4-phosphate cytidylyltransferase